VCTTPTIYSYGKGVETRNRLDGAKPRQYLKVIPSKGSEEALKLYPNWIRGETPGSKVLLAVGAQKAILHVRLFANQAEKQGRKREDKQAKTDGQTDATDN